MPFLISIYYALMGFPYDPAHESFLWLDSLAAPDTTYILPALAALSTWVISWQTTPKNVQGSQKTMLYIMPLFIGYISITFPSGLVIYWVVCNVFQFVQQTIMFRSEMTARLADARKGVVTVRTPKKDEAPKKRRAVKKQAEKAEEAPKKKRAKRPAEEQADKDGGPAKENETKETPNEAAEEAPEAAKAEVPGKEEEK